MSATPPVPPRPLLLRASSGAFLLAVLGVSLLAAGCSSSSRRDLQKNDRYYASPGYRSELPGDRTVFVALMKDGRNSQEAVAEESAAQRTAEEERQLELVRWMPEHVWERTPARMLGGILRDEIAASGVFGEVLDRVRPDAMLVQPTLLAFRAGQLPHTSGRSSIAQCAIRIEVLGPADADGTRPTVHDEVYAGHMHSPVMFQPPPVASALGIAVGRAMLGLLSGLDESNVARSGMPLATPERRTVHGSGGDDATTAEASAREAADAPVLHGPPPPPAEAAAPRD